MARRRETIFDILLILPWWASVIVAAIVYVLLAYAVPTFFQDNPFAAPLFIAAKAYAPFIAVLFLGVGAASFLRSLFIKKRYNSVKELDDIRKLSWREFESIVGEAFRRRGYSVLENAVDGADGGVDLLLRKSGEKFYVQCKHWKQTKVGVKPIRELYGVITAGDAAGGFFVASGEYTQDARDFAKKAGIDLIGGEQLAAMINEAREPQPFMDPTIRHRVSTTVHSPESPTCLNCGASTVRRVAKRGAHAGQAFWGCSSYPKCRGVRTACQ